MTAVPPDSFDPAAVAGRAVHGQVVDAEGDDAALAARWLAIHEAAAVIGALAGLAPEGMAGPAQRFPAMITLAGGQRAALVRQGMADLTVILETGVRALLTIHGRGVSPLAAARSLWQEFSAARDALLALAPQERRVIG